MGAADARKFRPDDFEPPVPRRNRLRSGGRSGLIPDVRMQERAGETCRSPDETGQRQIAPCRAQGAERLPARDAEPQQQSAQGGGYGRSG